MYALLFTLIALFVWFIFRTRIAEIFNFRVSRKLGLFVIIPSIIILSIAFILFYVKLDKQQYEYGFDCNFCEKKLPYDLEPNIDRYYTFTLKDDGGFNLVGNGFQYQRTDFVIKDFLGYGYNDASVLVKVTDSLNNIKYLSSYETVYISENGNPEVSFEEMSETKFQQIKNKYRWIDLDKEKAGKIRLYKSLSFTGAIISLLLLLWQLIRKRKVTH